MLSRFKFYSLCTQNMWQPNYKIPFLHQRNTRTSLWIPWFWYHL
jgi:hypothetical protein